MEIAGAISFTADGRVPGVDLAGREEACRSLSRTRGAGDRCNGFGRSGRTRTSRRRECGVNEMKQHQHGV